MNYKESYILIYCLVVITTAAAAIVDKNPVADQNGVENLHKNLTDVYSKAEKAGVTKDPVLLLENKEENFDVGPVPKAAAYRNSRWRDSAGTGATLIFLGIMLLFTFCCCMYCKGLVDTGKLHPERRDEDCCGTGELDCGLRGCCVATMACCDG